MPKIKQSKFVVYTGNGEVIVTTPALEKKMLASYFPNDAKNGRNVDEVHIEAQMQVTSR